MFFIYSFIDPRTNEVHFIGKTKRKDLRSLLTLSRLRKFNHPWLNDLLTNNLLPMVELITTANNLQVDELISSIQDHCKAKGDPIIEALSVRVAHNKGVLRVEIDSKNLIRLYHDERKTLQEVAEELNISKELLRQQIKRLGIQREHRAKYFCNHKYLKSIDTAEKAYILGFIATDGNIHESKSNAHVLSIQLSSKDKEILEKIKDKFEYSGPLSDTCRVTNGIERSYTALRIASEDLCKGLKRVGITTRKTHSIGPLKIPTELMGHFLRGAYDGDGSIVIKSNKASLLLPSASKDFLVWIQQSIESILPLRTQVNIYKDKNHFRLDYGSFPHVKGNAVSTILDYLYKDATIYLERKYQKYLEVKELEKKIVPDFKALKQALHGQGVTRSDGVTYPSISEAARQNGSRIQNIRTSLLNPQRTCKGFKWSYT